MGELVDVAGIDELGDGKMKGLTVNGKHILLARIDGTYYAVEDVCPHLKGRLSEGTLEGYTVTCPRHGSQFDVRTGDNTRWLKGSGVAANIAKVIKPPQPVKRYRTDVKENRIFVEID